MIQVVTCNKPEHQESLVSGICLRKDCKDSSACCMRCMKLHSNCTNNIKFLEEVPELLLQLEDLRDWFRDSFNDIKQLIAKLEKNVHQHFLPIGEYNYSQTLTNLNRLGQMLRNSNQLDIKVLDLQKQKICQDLDQFNDMIFNRNESQIQQNDKVVESGEEKDLVQKYFTEGEALYRTRKWQEAIASFDKALEIDEDHFESQFFKCSSLKSLGKLEEARECAQECYLTNPKKYNEYYKKESKLKIKTPEETLQTFDEQMKMNPNRAQIYINKGHYLTELERFYDAEQCYIEGLKHNPTNVALQCLLSELQLEMKKQTKQI